MLANRVVNPRTFTEISSGLYAEFKINRMKIILSRKGFDSGSGGAPSPIICNRPKSLPIPIEDCSRSETTYADLGLSKVVATATKGRLTGKDLCHHDPMFENGRCAFGQTGAAQGHLKNNNVGIDDTFLFFGLFSQPDGSDPHHRIFGYLAVDRVIKLGANPKETDQPCGFTHQHPHTLGEWNKNNTIYVGPGYTAVSDVSELRLTVPGGPLTRWNVPSWLQGTGLTYHGKQERWNRDGTLTAVSKGQEFVADISECEEAKQWLKHTVQMINCGKTMTSPND